jgi:hypothetical protein
MNTYTSLLNRLIIKRSYSTTSQNINTRLIARQKFKEFLNDINKSKDNVENISFVKWNTGYESGNTLLFNFTNESNNYEGQIFVRNITINAVDKLEEEYFSNKSIDLAKNN